MVTTDSTAVSTALKMPGAAKDSNASPVAKKTLSKGRSTRNLVDGAIKAEALKGARFVPESTPKKRLPKGVWLELAKTEDGRGVLRVRNSARDRVLFSAPLDSIRKTHSPHFFRDMHDNGFSFALWSSPLGWFLHRGGRILEVEMNVNGEHCCAAFVVKDPEAWVAALESPEWKK